MSETSNRPRWWIVALALGAALVAGGNWFLHLHSSERSPPEEAPAGEDEARVVCLGHVDVEFGVRTLYPAQTGRVVEVLVHEGDKVAACAPLLRVDDRPAQLFVRECRADLAAAEAQLQQARTAPAQHHARLAQQRSAIAVTQRRHSAAQHALERKRGLAKIEQLNEEEVNAAADLVEELAAALKAEQEKLRELELIDPDIAVRRAEEDVVVRRARLERAQQALADCTLRSPAAGEVLRILHGPGDLLGPQPKQPAVLFVPDGPRFIRAEVTQEFADRVQVGAPAVIEDDSRATRTWCGRVERISDWYTQRRSVMQEPLQVNDVRTVECIIRIEAGRPPLRIGQRVRVTLLETPDSRTHNQVKAGGP